MTLAITFGDKNISKWLDGILLVTRNVGQNRVPQLDQVGKSDGKMLSYIRADEGTIVVTAIVRTNVTEKRRFLADALTTSTPTKLIFADEPDIYYNAISTGQITLDEAYLHNTLTITFTVPDGIAHSVATKMFDNMPYKDVPVNLLAGTSTPVQATGNGGTNNVFSAYTFDSELLKDVVQAGDSISLSFDWSVAVQGSSGTLIAQLNKAPWATAMGPTINMSSGSGHYSTTTIADANWATSLANGIQIRLDGFTKTITISNMKFEIGTTASPWSPNPADPEYYSNTIMVHNGGTYPVEPVITATMHADNGMVGIVNDRPGIL
ncbi:phage tail family protein, partial [Lacticaseibacillus paracasei]|uniref:distal tail protein Dit n=1 Tax=Lacticaseibacillus paracasei TaxID=1597 RepID=UPI00339AA006